MSYIHCNSCNLFDSTHTCKNTLNCNDLQMVIATLKPSYKADYKLPHFFIVMLQYLYVFTLYAIALECSNYKLHCNFMFIVSIFATFSLNLEILLYFFSFSFIGHYHIDWTINPFLLGKAFCHLQKILYCIFFMLHI